MSDNIVEKIKSNITEEAKRLFPVADIKSHIFVPINIKNDGKWLIACSDKTDIQDVADFVNMKDVVNN